MFKYYSQNQIQLLPPDLESQLEEDHLARFISMAIDEMDISGIESQYSEKGENAYNPGMLLKLLIYGYAIGVRSSRKIARSARENIVFMWLSGRQTPDFRTVNDFRKKKLSDIKRVFKEVLGICKKLGMIRCGKVSLDGTKMEADANKHRVKYRKQLETQKEILEEKVEKILKEAEIVDQEEDALYGLQNDLQRTGQKADRKVIQELTKEIERRKQKIEKKRKEAREKKKDIDSKEDRMGGNRNSYSHSDVDATVMRMKEDYPAPGYNVQLATEHQVILAYGAYQKCTDNLLLRPMHHEIKEMMGTYPDKMIKDAGYGTKANTKYLKRKGQKYVMPYHMYNKERGSRIRGEYQKAKHPDQYWEDMKDQMFKRLESEEGKKLMRRRGCDVEAVIGDLKRNMNFRRFLLRGKKKVNIELGLASIGHNIKKIKSSIQYWKEYLVRMITLTILDTFPA